ncbi:MAG: metal ABC transporter permease [Prochlorococcaceae cyanobacterium]
MISVPSSPALALIAALPPQLEALVEPLIEPLQFAFLQRALGLGVLVAVVCAVLSCFMILKGWALMGDAVSHAVLPGVVIAYALGLPFAVGAFVFGVGAVGAIGFIKQHSRVKEDSVIGLVFTGFFAFGLVLLSKWRSSVDLQHILFGNLLGVADSDIQQSLLISGLVLLVLALRGRDLLLFCFDPIHARSIGLRTGLLHYLLLTLLSLAAVAGLQSVGIILVVAMLVTPGATGYLLSDRFGPMIAWAVLSAVLATVLGLAASYWLDASTAGCIVVVQTLQFLLVLVLAPRHGLLAQHFSLLAQRRPR